MLLGRSYQISSGDGGTGPLVDEDIEILVGSTEAPTFSDAKVAALAYRGRMSPGRTVTLRLPEGETLIEDVKDTTFSNLDFPELHILGQGTRAITSDPMPVNLQIDYVGAWGDDFLSSEWDVTVYTPSGNGLSVGDAVLIGSGPYTYASGMTKPLKSLGSICGMHFVTEVEETESYFKYTVISKDIAAALVPNAGGSLAGAPFMPSDFTMTNFDVRQLHSWLSFDDPALDNLDGFVECLKVDGCRIGDIGDFGLRVMRGAAPIPFSVVDSSFGPPISTLALGLIADPGVRTEQGITIDGRSDVSLGDVFITASSTYDLNVGAKGDRQRVSKLDAGGTSIYVGGTARSLEIANGIAMISAANYGIGIFLNGPCVFNGSERFVAVTSGPSMAFVNAIQASSGARAWMTNPETLDAEPVSTSPASGVEGNAGSYVYLI